jgi:hypothetical protein
LLDQYVVLLRQDDDALRAAAWHKEHGGTLCQAGPAPQAETVSPTSQPGEAASPATEACVPVEALTGAERQRHFRLRRQRDPLGEGHPCTWRTLLIKVAAEVVVRTRRIVIWLSSHWPHLEWYRRVCERLRAPLPTPDANPSG